MESRVERRTGIEGWFDGPAAHEHGDLRAGDAPAAPARWKQDVVIWTTFFPLSLLAALLLREVAPRLEIVVRVLASPLLLTPVMTYVALPFMTARLAWWLHGRPAPWRRAASGQD